MFSTERVETLAGRLSLFYQARWTAEDGEHACDIDKTYTKCLTPWICVVPMAKQIQAPLAVQSARKLKLMRGPIVRQKRNDRRETEETRFLIVKRIRDAILDETFKPGERLPEEQVGKMFDVSRSPAREALFALENEGTVVMEPFKGATLKPLSPEEALDIADLRLSLITLAVKAAQRHLSPADFDLAYRLAKQTTRTTSAKEYFEYDRRFWDIIFEKAQRPILWEVFRQLDDRMTRYHPLFLKLFPDPAERPRQREVLIESLREGKVDDAVRAFKKVYLEIVHQMIDYLDAQGF
jgi:DNA-binding GntR family transcriptional regulator